MKKSKIFIVNWHIFPFDILVCLNCEREQVINTLRKRYNYKISPEEDEKLVMHGRGRTVMLEGGQTVLWTKLMPKRGSGVLAHEIFHAVHFLLMMVGIKFGEDFTKDELPAYMIEYLNNQIVHNLKD